MNAESLKQHRSWLMSGGIVLLIAIWLMTGSGDNDDTAATPLAGNSLGNSDDSRSSVRTRQQVAEEVVRVVSVNGRTAPARTVELNAETDGRVVATGVERGDRFSAGNVIVRLDERDRNARLAQAVATVKQREVEYEGRQQLKSESYVSEAQLQEAAALLEAAKAELTRAELDIEYMQIQAPFDGALQERHVEIGDFVASGDPIATIVDDRTIIVSAAVSEYDAKHVTVGGEASAKLATGEHVSGRIRYIAPVADEATRTFTVELEIDNADGALRAGVSAELQIPAETVFAHRVSPSLLTLDDAGVVGIKVVNQDDVVEFFPADIALSSSEGVYIVGLPAAATIITVGQGFVNPGAVVNSVSERDVNTAVAVKADREED